jgi:hypothetical protein
MGEESMITNPTIHMNKQRKPKAKPVGGSKPGRKVVRWRATPNGCAVVIACQMKMYHTTIVTQGGFGPPYQMLGILEIMKETPKLLGLYSQLVENTEGDKTRMLKTLFDRGHKGYYDNKEDRTTGKRFTISPEHYDRNEALKPHVPLAKKLFEKALR